MHRPSFTIESWCMMRGVARSMFYKLKKIKKAPRVHYAGTKPLISPEADEEWLRAREAEAEQNETAEAESQREQKIKGAHASVAARARS